MTSSVRNRTSDLAPVGRRDEKRAATGRLGRAQARWNDYRGTAAADDASAVIGSRSLYEIADLDRSRWTIVGIDAALPTPGANVVVYAVDRSVDPDDRVETPGELGVTTFHLSASTQVEEFLNEAFQRVSIRLVSTLATDRALRVDSHVAQSPEQ